jgi:acylphosphatase
VQGVGYRMSCARVAESLGVGGSVRNRDDGGVEVVAVGPAVAVNRLVEWCRSGPRGAVVYDVAVTDEAPDGGDVIGQRFRIEG